MLPHWPRMSRYIPGHLGPGTLGPSLYYPIGWDIPGCPGISQDILDLGPWDPTLPPWLGHPRMSRYIRDPRTLNCLHGWDIPGCPRETGMSDRVYLHCWDNPGHPGRSQPWLSYTETVRGSPGPPCALLAVLNPSSPTFNYVLSTTFLPLTSHTWGNIPGPSRSFMQPKAAHGPGNEAIWLYVYSFFSPQTWPRPYSCRQVSIFPFVTVFEKEGNRERVGGWWTGEGGGSEGEGSEGGGGEWGRGEGVKRGRERKGWKWEGRDGGGRGEGGQEGREYVVCMHEVRQDVKYAFITAPYHVVSAPGPNQPQRGSCPILEAIRTGVGLGLWSRLLYHDDIMPVLILDVFQVWNIWHRQCIHKRSFMNGSTSPPTTPSLQAHARGSHANKHRSHSCDRARSTRILRYSAEGVESLRIFPYTIAKSTIKAWKSARATVKASKISAVNGQAAQKSFDPRSQLWLQNLWTWPPPCPSRGGHSHMRNT